jgi:hypothetical protein
MFCSNESDETLLTKIIDSEKRILERFFCYLPTECLTDRVHKLFIYRLDLGPLQSKD